MTAPAAAIVETTPDGVPISSANPPAKGFQRLVRKIDMCQMLGISARAFQDMIDAGCPVVDRGRGGKPMIVDVTAVLAWKGARDRRGENLAQTESANAASDARRRNHEAQAAMREFDLARIAGETVLVDEVVPILRDELATMRTQLLQLAGRIAPMIDPTMTTQEVEDLIDTEIRDVLAELTVDQRTLTRAAA